MMCFDVFILCYCLLAVHEKIFVVFMVMSLLYELLTLIVFKWAHQEFRDQPYVSLLKLLAQCVLLQLELSVFCDDRKA